MARIIHTQEFVAAKARYSAALKSLSKLIPRNVRLTCLSDFGRWLDQDPNRRSLIREAVIEYNQATEALVAEAMKPLRRNSDTETADEALLIILRNILRRNEQSVALLGNMVASEHRHPGVAMVIQWALTSFI